MDAFIEKYLLHAASHAENTLSGNYRKGNTAATVICTQFSGHRFKIE